MILFFYVEFNLSMLSDVASTSHAHRPLEDNQRDNVPEVNFKGKKRPPKKPYILPFPSFCSYCGAKLFRNESINFCCGQGDIRLAQNSIPEIMCHLFLGNDANASNFRKFMLFYNSSFAFTSYGVKKDPELTHRNRGIYTFRVQGQFYHFINDVLPTQEEPRYMQLYFFDNDVELWHRLRSCPDLTQIVVSTLMRIMNVNPYAVFFRSLREVGIHEESRIVIRADPTHDQRTHNAPTASQVAAIWVEDEGSSEPQRHDIVVYAWSGVSHRVRHYYGCYDPLQYPLLFPYGDTGWHRCIYKYNSSHRRREVCPTFPINEVLVQTAEDLIEAKDAVASSSESEEKVSCREYYCYRLQIRPNDSSILLRCGRLLQQYVVDMYIKLESTRLDFIRANQAVIRAELYQGVIDSYNAGQLYGANIGQIYILPSSFIGCGRDFRCRYLSSMSVVQRYGKPNIFLTMTCNPRWPEIERELLPHEEAQNRPDLVARVFRTKLIEVKKEIVEKKLFGNVIGYVYVVEFQKRGLPHAHFLIILDGHSKIRSPDQYDAFLSAEIPNVLENPHLHSAVLKHMMHGPCGRDFPTNPCMKNGNCKNHYPRDYADMTTNGRNSYPIYRRRQNEVCSTIKAVKYLYKYVYKGHDRVSFTVEDGVEQRDYDEITAFQSARWISPPEAVWRIFRFCMNEIHPNVVPLQVHLPNMQPVLFRLYERLHNIADDDNRKRTTLAAFFERNQTDAYARTLLYQQFPEHYGWLGQKDEKIWLPRRKGFAVGRLVYTNTTEGERYYLRLLLANIRGPQSFEDLCTVNNVTLSSFQESAYQRGLLEDDNSVENSLLEASNIQMPFALRRLFATLLIYCTPKSPRLL
ncbi:uncharacterized protein LOC141629731 [Silene latifolia]|uniref:uncharacterized protein LOC141629731 n=1 Tax=Silene latifolia TaxID=37657 RepID=UPI003D76FD82